MLVNNQPYRTVWLEGSTVRLIDQRLLPHRFEIVGMPRHEETARAIREMIVRGAPAIGAAGAFGLVQVVLEAPDGPGRDAYINAGEALLRATRPTAQNLFYALDRVRRAFDGLPAAQQADAARAEAEALADDDVRQNEAIGRHGAELLHNGDTLLTHCNAGWLATVDWGTALAPVYVARRAGRRIHVLADETRPRCQGANLTAWELLQEGVTVDVLADNAAGLLMRRGEVNIVITGADRIAANGDAANKIGTYEKALLAREHGIPFYIAAPSTTFDLNCPDGDAIPIEERGADEVHYAWGWTDEGKMARVRIAAPGAGARNPAFDVTPAELITGIITEHGIIPPTRDAIARTIAKP